MIASQLIYTSWKNGDSPKKGYMVYSKSADITTAEADEIHKVMRYEAPSPLPFTPTKEEIERLFPKNAAFFRLSSGRYCIAQASYVGQDYTGRWGNYIYHAYVTSDIEGIIPANFIGSGIFKTSLTEAELNAPSDPPPLPRVEITDSGVAISEKEIKAFFDTPEKKNVLKKILRGVLDSGSKKLHIYFTEASENTKYWVGAVSLMLPRTRIADFSFSTYVISSADSITLSCMYPGNNAGFYAQSAYTDEIMSINAEKDTERSDVGVYAELMPEKLLSDYYDTILTVNETASVMERYSVNDCDLAAKLLGAIHGDYSIISGADEFADILKKVCDNRNEDTQAIAESALDHVIGSAEINASNKLYGIYRYLYPKFSAASRKKLMAAYTEKLLKNAGNDLYESFKNNCPCNWQEAITMLSGEAFLRKILSFDSRETGLFAALVILDMYAVSEKDQQKQLLSYILGIYGEFVKSHDEARAEIVLKKADSLSPELSANVFVSVISGDMEYFRNDVKYLFSYLERRITNVGAFWTVLTKVVTIYPDIYLKCVKGYMELEERHPEAVGKLRAFSARSAEIKDFVDCTFICRYEAEAPKNADQIMDGYRKFVCAEYNNPDYAARTAMIFVNKVDTYLKEKNAKSRIKEAMFFFKKIFEASDDCKDVKLFSVICNGIFAEQTLESITKSGAVDVKEMIRVHDVSKKLGVQIDPKAEFYIINGYLACTAKGDRNSFGVIAGLVRQGVIENLMKTVDDKTACEFVSMSLDNALNTVYTAFESGTNGPFEPIYEPLIRPFSVSSNFVSEYIKSLKNNRKYIGYIFNYVLNPKGEFKNVSEQVIEAYLDAIGKSKRRELFDILLKSGDVGIKDKDALGRYINNYEKNHTGFWGKLFGGGKNKGDNK